LKELALFGVPNAAVLAVQMLALERFFSAFRGNATNAANAMDAVLCCPFAASLAVGIAHVSVHGQFYHFGDDVL
jgi:hypothetical protein